MSGTEITAPAFLICTLISLLLGLGVAALCPSALYRPACEAETES